MDEIHDDQLNQYGSEFLSQINEFGTLRSMFEFNNLFFDLILNQTIDEYINSILTDTAILHLQNGIVVFPNVSHNQSKYHKDFAKPFLSNRPLSLNTFIIIDDFTPETGATFIIPGSHLFEKMPSEKYLKENAVQISAVPGDVLIFDSTLWHCSGVNSSGKIRRAINQQFTYPFIKQQLDYPGYLSKKVNIDYESKLAQRLGFWTVPPKGVGEYRVSDPKLRTYRSGQG